MAEYDPKWGNAIASIESGGDYGQVTPSPGGRAAYGKYQVMGENIPEWTQAALGQSMTPAQFAASPDAQEAVFKHRFGGYVDKYGTPQDAASAWFTGRPINDSSSAASDKFGTTGARYVAKFNKAMGQDGPTAIDAAMGRTPSTGSRPMAYAEDDRGALNPQQPQGALTAGGSPVEAKPSWLDTLGQTLMNMAPGIAQDPAHAQVLASAAAAQQKAATQGTWSTNFDPKTGMATQINSANGQTRQIKYAAPKKEEPKWVADTGNGSPGYMSPELYAQSQTPEGKIAAAKAAEPVLLGDTTKQGPEYLQSIDPVNRGIIDGWHDGTGTIPSSFKASSDPQVKQLIASAKLAYPDMDFTKLNERKSFATEMTKNNPASAGGQVVNSNAAAQNLNNLADTYLAMQNSDGLGPAWTGHVANYLANANANPKRAGLLDALALHATNSAGEITKVLTGGPGGTHERAARAATLGSPRATGAEAAAAIEAELHDLTGKHKELVDKARNNMGETYMQRHPEIEKNFEDQAALLRDKLAQLREGPAATTKNPADKRPPLGDIFK
jgi:hypothetical protein